MRVLVSEEELSLFRRKQRNKEVGYLRSGFKYFPSRFAIRPIPTQPGLELDKLYQFHESLFQNYPPPCRSKTQITVKKRLKTVKLLEKTVAIRC